MGRIIHAFVSRNKFIITYVITLQFNVPVGKCETWYLNLYNMLSALLKGFDLLSWSLQIKIVSVSKSIRLHETTKIFMSFAHATF